MEITLGHTYRWHATTIIEYGLASNIILKIMINAVMPWLQYDKKLR